MQKCNFILINVKRIRTNKQIISAPCREHVVTSIHEDKTPAPISGHTVSVWSQVKLPPNRLKSSFVPAAGFYMTSTSIHHVQPVESFMVIKEHMFSYIYIYICDVQSRGPMGQSVSVTL